MASTKAPVVCVSVSALDAGHLTLPERLFVTDADPEKRSTVPSLAFLIQHPSPSISAPGRNGTNLVFDLGVKRNVDGYRPAQRDRVAQRQPVITKPDCADSLRYGAAGSRKGGEGAGSVLIDPARDIDFVVLSHVRWDHVGTPSDFSEATFLVGSGTQDLLRNGAGPLYPAELFNHDEVPTSHTVELPAVQRESGGAYNAGPHVPKHTETPANSSSKLPPAATSWAWKPLAGFPNALDLFGDGSVSLVLEHRHYNASWLRRRQGCISRPENRCPRRRRRRRSLITIVTKGAQVDNGVRHHRERHHHQHRQRRQRSQ